MQDKALLAYTFDKADNDNPAIKYAHRYVKHWAEVKAEEQVYNVVDSRYLSRLPFIITTNLTLAELKEPKDIAHARIYDRILECCAIVRFSVRNYHTENAETTKQENDHPLENADPLEIAEIKRRWQKHIDQLPEYAYLCDELLNE